MLELSEVPSLSIENCVRSFPPRSVIRGYDVKVLGLFISGPILAHRRSSNSHSLRSANLPLRKKLMTYLSQDRQTTSFKEAFVGSKVRLTRHASSDGDWLIVLRDYGRNREPVRSRTQ